MATPISLGPPQGPPGTIEPTPQGPSGTIEPTPPGPPQAPPGQSGTIVPQGPPQAQQRTGGQLSNTNTEPGLMSFTTFSAANIRRLSSDAFTTEDKLLIALKYEDCILVLFHVENRESHNLMRIWASAAQQAAGPIFASCNVLLEERIAQAFAKVRMNGSHPFNPYSLRQWPVIIAYRKGYPVAVYNGERATQPIIDWALTMACRADYFEPVQLFGSVQPEDRIEMTSPRIYMDLPGQKPVVRKSSVDFKTTSGIREYNPNIPVVATGSAAAAAETPLVREQIAREEGTTLTPQEATVGTATPEAATETPQELLQGIETTPPSIESGPGTLGTPGAPEVPATTATGGTVPEVPTTPAVTPTVGTAPEVSTAPAVTPTVEAVPTTPAATPFGGGFFNTGGTGGTGGTVPTTPAAI